MSVKIPRAGGPPWFLSIDAIEIFGKNMKEIDNKVIFAQIFGKIE